VACLERLLAEVPDADDVRATLVELYRAQGAWEPLVRALGEAASRAGDAAPVLAWAREAADVAGRQLGSLAPAVPALERAVALAPGDRGLELALAEGALAAGDTRRARQVLEGLLGQAGRRRSRERALVHHLLARVARAEGKPAEALSELEQASEIDMDDAAVLQALAEVAEQTGDLERAERAYRALILLLRRDRGGATVSSSEVLLRLRKLALDRGEAEKAVDLLDSAMAAAVQDGEEGESFAKALRERGDWELLQALSEKRFIAATDPAAQARILAELAGIAERQGRPAEAFDRYLSALERAPEEPEVRAGARRAAREADASARLLAAIEGIVAARRRTADAALLAELLLLAGEIQEDPLGDRVRAAELYARAAATGGDAGPPSVRAAAALVRLAKAGGGAEARAQALEALGRLAGEGTPREIREEALFSLAELALPGEETRAAGLDALARALEISGALDRAFEIVRAAGVPDRELAKVLPLYERAARASGDDEMLLDFLERRAALPSSTPDEIKEAVELARALNETSRAERLLGLAVERGRARAAGLAGLDWALLDLAQLRRNAGDLAGAAIWLEEARGVADPARLLRLLQDLGQRVQQGGHDPALAARIFEQLWEQEPVQRRHFEPLLAAHVARGDAAAVERVARGTIEKLLDPGERNGVRLAWARFLLTRDSTSRAAVDVLRDALLDDPAQREAIGLLADVYERTGDEEGLDDLLSRELAAARERGDQAAVGALTARLGARTARRSPAEARALYRASLALAPDDPALLRALVELPDDEGDAGGRRELLERLLAVESGGTAAALAVELADAWEAEGDAARAARALALGRARAPGDPALFSRLGALYRERRDWEPLATLLVEEAERRGASDAAGASSLLREAALVEREHLGRPAAAALRLRSARALAPDDRELLRDLVGTLVGLGDRAAAIAEVGAALSRPNAPGPVRVALLRLRADLREQEGDDEGAVADLEEAHGIAGGAIEPPLREALLRWKGRAAETSDADAERKAVLRLHELYLAQGSAEEAREILSDWTWRHPEDRETLQILLARDRAAERWEEVVETCLRLLEVEVGEAQLATAATLSEAAARLGQPEAAMPGLETVVRAQPDHQETFDRLVALYEQTGERRKRATLLFWVAEGTADEGRRFALYKQAGELLLREGEAQAATDAFQRALALQPGDRELALLVAETCIADGRLGEAEEILEGLMARAGKEMTSAELSMLQHRMAQLAAARGDGPARLDWLKRSFDTNRKNGEVAVELADLAEEAEDFDTAVKALRAVTLLPAPGPISAAVAFYRQARIAQRTGDRPRALIFAKRALQEDPRLAEAAELLKQIGERRA
jgi:tetratricopeptide (TPR) repeat protein/chorismate mutase